MGETSLGDIACCFLAVFVSIIIVAARKRVAFGVSPESNDMAEDRSFVKIELFLGY